MAILNYTTKIRAEKTTGEIQNILGKSGAQAVMQEYISGEVSAIAFQIEMNGQILSFRLPINSDGVLRSLNEADIGNTYKNNDQAKRTAWRIVKAWVEAQMALVEANQADIVEVFLPYFQDSSGETIYNRLKGGGFKQLTYKAN
jgi:hypothetical protein